MSDSFPENKIPLPFIREQLTNRIVDSKSILYKDDIVLLISRNKADPVTIQSLKPIEKFLMENRLIAGLSRRFRALTKLHLYFRQSIKAIDLGLRLENERPIFYYGDYYIYHTIDIMTKSLDYAILCMPFVLELVEYDRINNTDFAQSLFIYLTCNSNLTESAKIFYIHRNSMDYRIKKIQELFTVDLNDPEMIFSVIFSFKLLIYHKKFKPLTPGTIPEKQDSKKD